ncbi:MAG: hypothetical protein V1732_01075 [Patescibacteria group bacterium]
MLAIKRKTNHENQIVSRETIWNRDRAVEIVSRETISQAAEERETVLAQAKADETILAKRALFLHILLTILKYGKYYTILYHICQ